MTAIRKSGASNVALTGLRRRFGGAWANVQNGYRRQSGAWVKVYTAYTPISGVTASPNPTSGSATRVNGPGALTVSANTSLTVVGGSTLTYSAALLSGTAMTVSAGSTTTFSYAVPQNTTVSATYRITVSDGTSSKTVDVPVSLTYNNSTG